MEYEDVGAEIEDEIRALDYGDLNARAGSYEWGYVEPSEAAWEILEETVEPFLDDLKRHIELGLEAEAFEICKGMVLGLYRLSEREGGDVLGWALTSPPRRLETPWNSGMPEPTSQRVATSVEERALRFLRPAEHGSQVDFPKRAHVERDEVTPTARPLGRRRFGPCGCRGDLACRPLVRRSRL